MLDTLIAPAPPRHATWPGRLLAVISLAVVLSVTTHADPDLWGHLRFGLDALRDHALPSVDPYSFTQDVPWINHEWLSEVILAASYRSAGVIGILLLKAALVSTSLALVWWALRGASTIAHVALSILVAWAALPLVNTHRPQLWSWLAVPLILVLLRGRGRWAVPLVFAGWANLHGGWVVGIGLVAVWTVSRLQTRDRAAVGLFALCGAATLVTPYGWHLWTFLASTVRLGRPDIQEWQPIWTAPLIGLVPYGLTWGLLGWAVWQRRIAWPLALGCALLGLASGRVMRLVPFFVQAVAIWTAPPARVSSVDRRIWIGEAVAALLILGTVLRVQPTGAVTCLDAGSSWAPDRAVQLTGRGTLLVPFAWGEYALAQWGPDLRVSLDGRRETVYSDAVVGPQLALLRDDVTAAGLVDQWRPDAVWYPQGTPRVKAWLLDHGYRLAVDTPRSYVLLRPDVPIHATLAAAPACFTMAR